MNHRRRHAFSFAELLVTMSLLSFVMTTGVALVHRAMHEQKRSSVQLYLHRVANRLSAQFRADVHQTRSWAWLLEDADSDVAVQLNLDANESVVYRIRGQQVRRTLTRSTEVVQREEFDLPSGIQVQIAADEPRNHLRLTIVEADPRSRGPEQGAVATAGSALPPLEESGSRLIAHVDAAIGFDLRFAAPPDEPRAAAEGDFETEAEPPDAAEPVEESQRTEE